MCQPASIVLASIQQVETYAMRKYINVKETECNEINSLANTKKLTPNGKYFIRSAGDCEYVDGLGEHYDYECFGKDHIAHEHGVFDEAGYVAYTGKAFVYSASCVPFGISCFALLQLLT